MDDGPVSSFQGRSSRASASSFHASLLQAINGVMSLALCPKVVSQASRHLGSSKKQATCEDCFACLSTCLVVSLHSGMFWAVHLQEVLKVNVDHWHIPVWASHSTFHFLWSKWGNTTSPYQQIHRLNDVKEHFILPVFDSLWAPGHSVGDSHWWPGCYFQFLTLLSDVPEEMQT